MLSKGRETGKGEGGGGFSQSVAIPGLPRNSVLYQGITVLDAGSSPAWQAGVKRFFEF